MVPQGHWDNSKIEDFWKRKNSLAINDNNNLAAQRCLQEQNAIKKIVAAKYTAINIGEVLEDQHHLTALERDLLKKMLRNRIKLFQGQWE